MNDQFADIATDRLLEPWVLLRPIGRESIEYLEMRSSIDEIGLLNSLAVRPSKKEGYYEVIDGMWRLTCARELEFPTVPCIIKFGITNEQVLALQIQANAIRPTTKPVEFARQLKRIQKARPEITLAQLSSFVNKEPGWVRKQLGLLRLDEKIQKAIDRGEIPLGNAYMLSMIPPKLRPEYVDFAKTMEVKAFKALAASVIKQFKEAVKQGRLEAFFSSDFHVQSYLRSLKDIEAEVESQEAAPFVLVAANCTTPMEGWLIALQWALHLDQHSVEEQEKAARDKTRKKWKGA